MQPFQQPYGIPQMGVPIPTMMMPPHMYPVMMAPPGGVRPVAAPLIPAPRISSGPVIVAPPQPRVEKPIALYIGHLTSVVKDDFFKMLLGYCGHMKSWKRVTSSFGFVEYYSPDSALRAMRVLGGRTLFGKNILVNADKKTKESLDKFTEDVKQGKARPLTHPGDNAIGKTGEQIMADQDAVATNLIQTLIAAEIEKQGVEKEASSELEKSTPSKTRGESKKRSKSPDSAKVAPSISASGSRLQSSSRKRSRSRSPSPSPSPSRERRRRSRHKRSRSRSRRSHSRHRRKRRRKKRKKERRKRSKRRESTESEKSLKKERHKEVKETKEPEPDINKLPERGSENAPKDAKQLVSYIPKDQEKLFQYPIDWDLVEKNDLVEKVMRVWIDARIQEYLGEQEADLTNFALGLLAHRIPPKDIISEMEMVLVEDAEGFVVKMWRRIIFESLKVKYMIS